MTKRFFSLIAVLAISLLAACAQITSHPTCKSCPFGVEDCCGACPCGAPVVESAEGKMCDPAMKKKHHRKHHHAKAAAAPTAAPTIPASAPPKDAAMKAASKAKAAPKAAPKAEPKAEPEAKKIDVLEGVKKIIQDVTPKDTKKPQ